MRPPFKDHIYTSLQSARYISFFNAAWILLQQSSKPRLQYHSYTKSQNDKLEFLFYIKYQFIKLTPYQDILFFSM